MKKLYLKVIPLTHSYKRIIKYIGLKNGRNINIDFYRGCAILLVILGHCQLPHWLHEIKCFIVPMLVFCSGLTCKGKSNGNYWSYIGRRIKRILIPCYIFTLFFYTLFYLETYITTKMIEIDWHDIANAFLLRTDSMMGYLWVMKVFLLVMLVTPLAVKLVDKIQSIKTFLTVFLVMVVFQQCLVQLCDFIPVRIIRLIYREYFLYLTGYLPLFLLGIKMGKIDEYYNHSWLISLALWLIVFVSYVTIYGLPYHLLSQKFKYPPHFWFILYGAVSSITLWCFIRKKKIKGTASKFCVWVGQNTMWFFLWHIIGLRVSWMVSDHWAIKYIVVLAFCVIIYALQYIIVRKINKPFFNKYFIG